MNVAGDQIGLNLLGCKTLKGGNVKKGGSDHMRWWDEMI